jgi:cytochrome c oxidase subunit II
VAINRMAGMTVLSMSGAFAIPVTAVCEAAEHHVLHVAGPQAARIEMLWSLLLVTCAITGVLVLAAVAVALWRAPRGNESTAPQTEPDAGRPLRRRTVTAAVALSAIALTGLIVASVVTDRALAQFPVPDALPVKVTGHQWWWELQYDPDDPARLFSTANELYVPVGRPVLLTLESADVIHSFWVPSLHGKLDLIPGKTATLRLRAERSGRYRGQCAEFCGLQHAHMALLVVALPPADFEKWRERQHAPATESADPRVVRGREVFLSGPCAACHTVNGTPAGGRLGPDLTHIASRSTLAAGTLPNDRARMADWISNPQHVKPGANMPAIQLAPPEMDALLAYLESLT